MLREFSEFSYMQSYNAVTLRSRTKGEKWMRKDFQATKNVRVSPLLIINTMKCGILFFFFHVNSFSLYFALSQASSSRRISSAFISVQFFFLFHQPLPYNDALLRRGNSSLPSTNATEQDRTSLTLQTSIISAKSNSKMKNRVSARDDVLFFQERSIQNVSEI